MSNRTFACLHCRKLQRKLQTLAAFCCPHCGRECLRVPWKLHVPAPCRRRKWDAFWAQYFRELRLVEQFRARLITQTLELPLLNQVWIHVPARSTRKKDRRAERRLQRSERTPARRP